MSRLNTFYRKLKSYSCIAVHIRSTNTKSESLNKIGEYSNDICPELYCDDCPWHSTTQQELKNVFEPMA